MQRRVPVVVVILLCMAASVAALECRVVTPDGAPLAGARIIVMGRGDSFVADADGLSLELPCYHYRDHLIWGMTLAMVDELLSLVSR